MRAARLLSLLCLVTLSTPCVAQPPTACLEKVSPSVYAVIRDPATRYQETNSAFVVTSLGVVAVDPSSDRSTFDCALEALAEVTDAEVTYVVYTHWHGDHTGGAGYLARVGEAGGAVILAAPVVDAEKLAEAKGDHDERLAYYREQLPRQAEILASGVTSSGREITAEEREMLEGWIPSRRKWVETHDGVRFVPPQLAVDGELRLRSEPEVVVSSLSGHTAGDLVVFVPEEGVLMAGDLVDRIPFAGHGSLAEWQQSLDRLEALEPQRIVPGHGPLYDGTAQLARLRAYFDRASELAATEGSPEKGGTSEGSTSEGTSGEGASEKGGASEAERLLAAHGDELASLLLPDGTPEELETFGQMAGSVLEAALTEIR